MNLNDELQYNILLDEVDELELEMIELDEEIRIEELLEHERVLVINKINLQETLEQIRIDKDLQNLEDKFQTKLSECIENYWSNENQELLRLQTETINKTYSWEERSKEWIGFLKKLKN